MAASVDELRLTEAPVASTGMLIRKPVAEVFEALVDPAVTTRFWFTHGSGRLAPDARVQWEWRMYGVVVDVVVRAFEQDRRVVYDWSSGGEPATTVEYVFDARLDGTTFVSITNSGFQGSGDERCRQACDSTQGFSFVLAGLKALLEHGIELNLVPDRYPG